MKLALTWTAKKRKFAPLVLKGDFTDSLSVVHDLGYNGMEMSIRTSGDVNSKIVLEMIQNFNLEISAVSTGLAYGEDGLSFNHSDKAVRLSAEKRFKEQIDFASAVKSENVIFGLLRGKLSDDDDLRNKQQGWIKESVKSCSEFAKEKNVTIIIEPINRYETNYLNTMNEVGDFISEIGSDNLKMMADTFHMNIEEKNMEESIIKHKKKIGYVHLADSNREMPGRGHLDFKSIIRTLKDINYSGYMSLECIVDKDLEKEALQAHQYLTNLINV